MSPFFHENKIIPTHQSGVRTKYGTIEQVNRPINVPKEMFLDLAQTFDKVLYENLLYNIKLKQYLLPNCIKDWSLFKK